MVEIKERDWNNKIRRTDFEIKHFAQVSDLQGAFAIPTQR